MCLVAEPWVNGATDLQHDISLLVLDGKLGKAPVKDPRHALDVGTGTGIWALQFGMSSTQRDLYALRIDKVHKKPNKTRIVRSSARI